MAKVTRSCIHLEDQGPTGTVAFLGISLHLWKETFFPGGGPGPGPGGPGPGRGRALYTRHYRENFRDGGGDVCDYDRELRNFGYQRERDRQRQRAQQQEARWRGGDGDSESWDERDMGDGGSMSDDSASHSCLSASCSDDDDDDQQIAGNPDWPELRTGRFRKEDERRSSGKRRQSSASVGGERSRRSQASAEKRRHVAKPQHSAGTGQSREHKDEDSRRRKVHQSRGESSGAVEMEDSGECGDRQSQAFLTSPGEGGAGHSSRRSPPPARTSERSSDRHRDDDQKMSRSEDSGRRRDQSRSSRSDADDRRDSQRRDRSPLERSRGNRTTKASDSRSDGRSSIRNRARSRSRSPLSRTEKHGVKESRRRRTPPRQSPAHQSPREESHRSGGRSMSPQWPHRGGHGTGDESRHSKSSSDQASSQQRPPSPSKSPPPPPPVPASSSLEPNVVPQVYAVPASYPVTAVPAQSATTFVYSTQSGQQIVAEMLPAGAPARVVAQPAPYVTGANQSSATAVSTVGEERDGTVRHSGSLALPSGQVAVIQNTGIPMSTPPPPQQQADALLGLLHRYPVMWQGHLALKNDIAAVQMHFLSGSQRLAQVALPQPGANPQAATLRIAQRMRLEQSQLDGVARRMQVNVGRQVYMWVSCGSCFSSSVLGRAP